MVFILIKKDLKAFVLILWGTITVFLIFYIIISKATSKVDKDYKKLDLELESYNINYYTVYEDDSLMKYKVYKLSIIGENDKFRNKLEESSYWSKNKFYEYEMKRFYERVGEERIELDRENLYYYANKGIYAIFDLKNEKLYYLKSYIYGTHNNYSNILGVNTENYIKREIYSVREGIQYDGLDYYVYEFSKENGQDIVKKLDSNSKWSKNRLDDSILDDFEYNKEVLEIKNGYYHYELVCRTSDENKKHNFTKEEATGWEIGVYDADKNILYYYWQSI
jgi:hypothetical protein